MPPATTRGMRATSEAQSPFLLSLHILMWTVLTCGLIAVMIVLMLH